MRAKPVVPAVFHRSTTKTSVTVVRKAGHTRPGRWHCTRPQLPIPIVNECAYRTTHKEDARTVRKPACTVRKPVIFGSSTLTPHLLFLLGTIRAVTHPGTDVLAIASGRTARRITRSTRSTLSPGYVRPSSHLAIFTLAPQRTFVVHTVATRKETVVTSFFFRNAIRLDRSYCARAAGGPA